MSFPRYPQYKDSGVEWLGEVPGHWEIDRLKRSTLSTKNGVWGDEPQQDESDIPCVRVADFDRQSLRAKLTEPTIRNVVDSERVGRVLEQGDLLLEKSGGGETQPVGCVVLYDDPKPAVCSNFVARVQTATGMSSSFWRYVHAATYAVRLNTKSIKQTSGIQNLDASQYFDERAAFPPLAEQTQIAAFLDRETAKIDDLVAQQRRLMALRKEKRQAVVSHAVTQGLNPQAPMKPSGIEWLGDVPAHWRIGKCGFYLSILSGFAFPSIGFSENETDTKLLRGINVGISQLKWNETVYWRRKPDDDLDLYEMQEGDLVIGMDRPLISAGMRVAKVKESDLPCLLLQRVASIKTGNQLDADYLLGLLSSEMFVAHFSPDTTGVSVPHISPEQINNFVIPVPPVTEQRMIVEFVEIESAKFDTLTTEAQRAIDLLQERRTALISAAVTGQIDVRNAF
jgi:type I restriction enzyme, S subunit